MTKNLQLLSLFLSALLIVCGNNFGNNDNENEIALTEERHETMAELEDIIENQHEDGATQARLNQAILSKQIRIIIPPMPPCPVGYTTAVRRDRAQGNCASQGSSVIG